MFESVYSQEMEQYFNMRSIGLSDSAKAHELLYLKRFDSYLQEKVNSKGQLNEECINGWVCTLCGKSGSVENVVITIRQFLKFLSVSGEPVFLPTVPKARDDYQPYIFSDDELAKIFVAADNITLTKYNKELFLPLEFPVILRLLFSCGMRLTETISIDLKNVNFENGVIRLEKTKRRKQRLVPLTSEMTSIVEKYCMVMGIYGHTEGWLFPSSYMPGHIPGYTVRTLFAKILRENDINLPNRKPHERGPCLHCLRHVFVFKSFAKCEREGFSIDQSVPYLSIFLGHDSLAETEKYMKFSNELFPETVDAFGSFMNDLLPEVNYES